MEQRAKNEVTLEEILAILGAKEVEVQRLRRELAERDSKVSMIEKSQKEKEKGESLEG